MTRPTLDLEVGRQAGSALAIIEAEAPRPILRSSLSEREGEKFYITSVPQVLLKEPQEQAKPTSGYMISSRRRACLIGDASKKIKLAL